MNPCIGIRREDKNIWERRVPVIPEHVRQLREKYSIEVWVQPSEIRVFREEEFAQAGARVEEDLSACPVIFAIKEIPAHLLHPVLNDDLDQSWSIRLDDIPGHGFQDSGFIRWVSVVIKGQYLELVDG